MNSVGTQFDSAQQGQAVLPGGSFSYASLLAWLAPFLLVGFVVCTSPNFDTTQTVRESPLGSDFLQDWVGAKIITSADRELLYDSVHFQALQHDPNVVGFHWPSERYYPMVYPPFFYSLLRPLANMPYQSAIWCWMLLLSTGLGATLTLVKGFAPARKYFVGFAIASLLFAPLLFSLNMAHKSVLLLLIFTATYIQLYRGKHFSAGLTFGLLAFKPHLAVLVGIALLLKRQWSFVFGSALTVSLLLLLSWACGSDLCHDYIQQALAMGSYTQHGGYQLSEAVNLNAAAELLAGDGVLAASMTWTVSLAILAALWLSLSGPLQTKSKRFAAQFSMLMLAVPLLSPHFYIYDLTIMLLPLLLLVLIAAGTPWEEFDWQGRQCNSPSKLVRKANPLVAFLSAPRTVIYTIAAFYFLAAFFSKIAATTSFQPASFLLLLLVAIAGTVAKKAG